MPSRRLALENHRPRRDRWRSRHPNVPRHSTPTHASSLREIEICFSILTRQALGGARFTSPRQVREAIDRLLAVYNAQPLRSNDGRVWRTMWAFSNITVIYVTKYQLSSQHHRIQLQQKQNGVRP